MTTLNLHAVFSKIKLHDVHEAVFRNIVSIQTSQDLFDDLSAAPEDWALAQLVEDDVKPPTYFSSTPIIHRPFEDAHWFNAIQWPFEHWQSSRYSDGKFGVWYGAESVETTVYETVHHWVNGFLSDADFTHETVQIERKVYAVNCDAALLDLRPACAKYPVLTHKSDYTENQSLGARLHKEGHPGLICTSVRRPEGHNFVILNPKVLSDPKHHCQLSYRLEAGCVSVHKGAGRAWLRLDGAAVC